MTELARTQLEYSQAMDRLSKVRWRNIFIQRRAVRLTMRWSNDPLCGIRDRLCCTDDAVCSDCGTVGDGCTAYRRRTEREKTEYAGSTKAQEAIDFYYGIVILILLLFNFFAMPWLAQRQVREVDYGTFIDMAENQELGQVESSSRSSRLSLPIKITPRFLRPV